MWKIIESYDAVGGPKQASRDGGHTKGPTRSGRYTLTPKTQFLSTVWPFSRIRWGTPIRWDSAHDDVLYNERGHWRSVRQTVFNGNPREPVIASLQALLRQYGGTGFEQPNTWIFNDFGHVTYFLFEDRDGDGKLDHGERIIEDFLHTTPDNEFQTAHGIPIELGESHGCIHIKPAAMDEMAQRGYLKAGVHFMVHKYGEQANSTIVPMKGSRQFELHFYPTASKIFVYAPGI
jgi:hypothetical protein